MSGARLAGLALLATLFAPACGGAPRVRTGLTPQPYATPAVVDRAGLVDEVAQTVRESYRALNGGYEEAYLDGLARDARLVLIDVGSEVVVGFDPLACRLRRQIADARSEFVSRRLDVQVSDDGTVAWTHDALSYRAWRGGRRVLVPLRATAVFERRTGRWLVVQQHVSYALLDEDLRAVAPARAPLPVGELGEHTSPGGESARALVLGLIRGTAKSAPSFVIGPTPDAELHGADARRAGTIPLQLGDGSVARVRDLRVTLSRSARVAWAAANLEATLPGADGDTTLALRATWVLVRASEGDAWLVAQTHLSAPVSLVERVFGAMVAVAGGAGQLDSSPPASALPAGARGTRSAGSAR